MQARVICHTTQTFLLNMYKYNFLELHGLLNIHGVLKLSNYTVYNSQQAFRQLESKEFDEVYTCTSEALHKAQHTKTILYIQGCVATSTRLQKCIN